MPAVIRPFVRDVDPPFDADTTLEYIDPPHLRRWRQSVAVVTTLVFASYLVYRGLYTLNPEAPVFSGIVYLAEIHGFFSLLFYFHSSWALRRRRVPPTPRKMTVDIFITTYNEDVDLLRQTVRAAIAIRYPHRTYVLDDGRRPAVRAMCEELGCDYITRTTNEHAKAGNWNNAFKQTDGDVIVTFDADHVPRANFLERTLGFFRDPKVALVQVPQQYHNLDSVQHRVDWETRRMYAEQDVFFDLVMPGKDNYNAAFFCGTGALLRREALVKHGGIITGTITEDLHTAVVLHSEGWKSVYVNEVLVTGLAPMDFASFEVQRLRWAEGNLRTLAYINPLTCAGLSFHQRVSYVASLYHWTIGVPKLVFYLSPPWMLLSRTFPIANFDHRFLAIYLGFLGTLLLSYRVMSRGAGNMFMDEVFNMASFFTMIRALKRAILGRGAGLFVVTDKKGSGANYKDIIPHLALLATSILAVSWSWMGLGFGITDDWFGAGIASFWTFVNMALVAAVLQIALRPPQKRQSVRFRAGFPVELDTADDRVGMTADISEGGCTLLWPTSIPRGEQLTMTLHLGDQPLTVDGRVVAAYGRRGERWIAHGVQFVGIDQAHIDLVNDAFYTLVVPTLFSTLSEPTRSQRLVTRLLQWRSYAKRKPRQLLALPVRVSYRGRHWMTTTRDIGEEGLSLSTVHELPVGAELDIEVLADTPWARRVVVTRCTPLSPTNASPLWQCGLRFDRRAARRDVERFHEWMAA